VEVEPSADVRPWGAHETALRMLTNLVHSYRRRGDLTHALRAAEMRLALPSDPLRAGALRQEWLSLQSRLN
jgi:regulator of sirC expression with transglutaminase-like and TPR domain